ncbi:hypothetical protein GCM10025762_09600 [Haloechinothrix salitolerans]
MRVFSRVNRSPQLRYRILRLLGEHIREVTGQTHLRVHNGRGHHFIGTIGADQQPSASCQHQEQNQRDGAWHGYAAGKSRLWNLLPELTSFNRARHGTLRRSASSNASHPLTLLPGSYGSPRSEHTSSARDPALYPIVLTP